MVTLPMTKSIFAANEYRYISSVATTAGVVRENVKVLSIDEIATQTSRKMIRLLRLAIFIHVKTSILMEIGQITNIQESLLNSNLQKYGLPSGTLFIQNVNTSVVTNVSVGPGSTAASADNIPIGAIVGGAGGFAVLVGVTILGLRWRKQNQAYLIYPQFPPI
jgi:hypothetical protein